MEPYDLRYVSPSAGVGPAFFSVCHKTWNTGDVHGDEMIGDDGLASAEEEAEARRPPQV